MFVVPLHAYEVCKSRECKSCNFKCKCKKVKTISITGRGGPWGYETSRLTHLLDNPLIDGGGLVSLTRRPAAVYPQEVSWHSFLLEVESKPRAIVRLEGLSQLKKSNDIENRTRGLPTCSTVAQLTMLLCALKFKCTNAKNAGHGSRAI
jgi:hypothetical protein